MGEARAINGLGEQAVGLVLKRLHDDIEGLGHADAELVHIDRLNILAITGHDRHFQAGNAQIEKGHGGSVDHPQADFFARCEQAAPAGGRCLAVHQEGVGVAGDIGNVAVAHAHPFPHLTACQGGTQTITLDFGDEIVHQ